MNTEQALKELEAKAAELQQALIDEHEWKAFGHLQNAMHELHEARAATTRYQVELAKSLYTHAGKRHISAADWRAFKNDGIPLA